MEISSTAPSNLVQMNINNGDFNPARSNAKLSNDSAHKTSQRNHQESCEHQSYTHKENHDFEDWDNNKKTRRVAFASDVLGEKSCSTVVTEPAVGSHNLSHCRNSTLKQKQSSGMASPRRHVGSVRFNDELTIVTPQQRSSSMPDSGRKGDDGIEGESWGQDFNFRCNRYDQDRRLPFNMAHNPTNDADLMAQTSSLLDGIDTSDDLECTTAVFSTSDWLNSEHKSDQDSREMTFPDCDNSMMSSELAEVNDKKSHIDMLKAVEIHDDKRKKTLPDNQCGVNTVDNCLFLPYKNAVPSQTSTTKTTRTKSEMEKVSLKYRFPDHQVTAPGLTEIICRKCHCEISPRDVQVTSKNGAGSRNSRLSGSRTVNDHCSVGDEAVVNRSFCYRSHVRKLPMDTVSTRSTTGSTKTMRPSAVSYEEAKTIDCETSVHRKSILKKTQKEISTGSSHKNIDFLESLHSKSAMIPPGSNTNYVHSVLTLQGDNFEVPFGNQNKDSQSQDITNVPEFPNSSAQQNSQTVTKSSFSVQCNLPTPNPTISRLISTTSPKFKERPLSINSSNNTKLFNSLECPSLSQEASFISNGIQCDLSYGNSHVTFGLDDSTTAQVESYALDQSTLADSLHVKDSSSLKLMSEIKLPADSQHLKISTQLKNNSYNLAGRELILQHSNENYTNIIHNDVYNQERLQSSKIRSKNLVLSNSTQVSSKRNEEVIIKEHEQINQLQHQFTCTKKNHIQQNEISDHENSSRKSQTLKIPRLKLEEINPGHQDILELEEINLGHQHILELEEINPGHQHILELEEINPGHQHILELEEINPGHQHILELEEINPGHQHITSQRQEIQSEHHDLNEQGQNVTPERKNTYSISRRLDSERHVIPSKSQVRPSKRRCVSSEHFILECKDTYSELHIKTSERQTISSQSQNLPLERRQIAKPKRTKQVIALKNSLSELQHIPQELQHNSSQLPHDQSLKTEIIEAKKASGSQNVLADTLSVSKIRKTDKRELLERGSSFVSYPNSATQAKFTLNRRENSQSSRREMNVVAVEERPARSKGDKSGLSASVTDGKKNFTALYITWAQVLSSKETNIKCTGDQRSIAQPKLKTTPEKYPQPTGLPEIQHDLQQSVKIKERRKTGRALCVDTGRKAVPLPLVLKDNLFPLTIILDEKDVPSSPISTDKAAPSQTVFKEKSLSKILKEKASYSTKISKEKAVFPSIILKKEFISPSMISKMESVSPSMISKESVDILSKSVEVSAAPKLIALKDNVLTTLDAKYDPSSTVSKEKTELLKIDSANSKEIFSSLRLTGSKCNEPKPKVSQRIQTSQDNSNDVLPLALSGHEPKVNKPFNQNRSVKYNTPKKTKHISQLKVNRDSQRNVPINEEVIIQPNASQIDMGNNSFTERTQGNLSPIQSSSKRFQLSLVLDRLKMKSKKNCNKKVLTDKESFLGEKQKLEMSNFRTKRVDIVELMNHKTDQMTLGFNNNVRMDSTTTNSNSITDGGHISAPKSKHSERNKESTKNFSFGGKVPTPAKIVQGSPNHSSSKNASRLPEMQITPHLEWSSLNQILNSLEPANQTTDGTQERSAPITKRYFCGEHIELNKTRILHIVNERDKNIQGNPTEKKNFTKSIDSRSAELRVQRIQTLTQNISVDPSADASVDVVVSSGIAQGKIEPIYTSTTGEENLDEIYWTRTEKYDTTSGTREETYGQGSAKEQIYDQGSAVRAENHDQGSAVGAENHDQGSAVGAENHGEGIIARAENSHEISEANETNYDQRPETRDENYVQSSVGRAKKYNRSPVDEIELIKQRGSSVDDWFSKPREAVASFINTRRNEDSPGHDESKLNSGSLSSKSVHNKSNEDDTRDEISEEIRLKSLSFKDGTSKNETITPTENKIITPTENGFEFSTETESESITEDEIETSGQQRSKRTAGIGRLNRHLDLNQFDSSKFAKELYTLLSQMATREPSHVTSHAPSRLPSQAEGFLQATGKSPISVGQKTIQRQPTGIEKSGFENMSIKGSPYSNDSGIGFIRSSTIDRSNIHHSSEDPANTSQIDQQRWHHNESSGRNVKKELLISKPRLMTDCYYYSDVNAIQLSIKPIDWPNSTSSRRQDSSPLALNIRFHIPSVGEHAVKAAGNK